MAEIGVFKSGKVNISDDVIGIIGSIAASEIEGVYSLSGSFSEEMMEKIGKKNLQKGVEINMEENTIDINLHVILEYGAKFIEVCQKVQEEVKNAIESMTGLQVNKVDIQIDSINFKKNKKDA